MTDRKIYRTLEYFKEDLLLKCSEIGEFFFMVFEPNEPVRFSNSESMYDALFNPSQNKYIDISILFPEDTVFINGYGFVMRVYKETEEHWTEIWTQADYFEYVSAENRAMISLLGLELDLE